MTDETDALEPADLHPELAPYFTGISNLDPPMEARDPLDVRALMDGFAMRPFFRAMHVSPYVRREMREMGRQIRRHLVDDLEG